MIDSHYDIIILGGGIAGSIMGISLSRKNPNLKILILEKSQQFPNKVGESSADITGLFFNRFNIDSILKKQVPKAGLRFLFNEQNSSDFSKMNEFSSPSKKSIANGYHFNRNEFDEDLLTESQKIGVKVLRPAQIINLNFKKFDSEVVFKFNDTYHLCSAKWVIDASGTERIVGKLMKWEEKDLSFDTGAVFAHFENLRPISDWDFQDSKAWLKVSIGPRNDSTIHFLRHGCWWWHIKLNKVVTSIGVVYDKNITGNVEPGQFFDDFLKNDEQLKFITKDAKRGASKILPKLPYLSKQLYEEGLVVIGDSAAFVDPLFSPGIELSCQQSIWITELISDYFAKGNMNHKKWKQYEKIFINAFKSRMMVYENRYKLMESYDLFSNWAQLDFFGYYGNTVIPSVLFPKRIKYPYRFSFLTKKLYFFYVNRYLSIAKKRKTQNRISSSLKSPVTYSHVGVPKGIRIYFKTPHLFIVWFTNYIRIELDELKHILFKQRNKI